MRTMLLLLLVTAGLACSPMIRSAVKDAIEQMACILECELGAISTPVTFTWTKSIAAGATYNPLAEENWQYETPDFDGMIEVLSRAVAVGIVETISSAGDTLKQEAPVQAGGTAGVIPSRLNTDPVIGRAARSQKIFIKYRNTSGGAVNVDGQITLTPLSGGGGSRRRAAPRRFGRRR